jgi:hypothetical protein
MPEIRIQATIDLEAGAQGPAGLSRLVARLELQRRRARTEAWEVRAAERRAFDEAWAKEATWRAAAEMAAEELREARTEAARSEGESGFPVPGQEEIGADPKTPRVFRPHGKLPDLIKKIGPGVFLPCIGPLRLLVAAAREYEEEQVRKLKMQGP